MPDVYHASHAELAPGTILESHFRSGFEYQYAAVESALSEGGQALKALLLIDYYIEKGKPRLEIVLKEAVFEAVRKDEFRDRLSRYDSVFLCRTIADVKRFSRAMGDYPHLYSCSLPDSDPFIGDMSLVRRAGSLDPINDQLDYLNQNARRYWQGERTDAPDLEVLARSGTVTILAPV